MPYGCTHCSHKPPDPESRRLVTNSIGDQFKVVMHSDLGNTNSMEEAVVWLSKAAEQGYVEAYNSLVLYTK